MQISAKELRHLASDVDDMHHEAMRIVQGGGRRAPPRRRPRRSPLVPQEGRPRRASAARCSPPAAASPRSPGSAASPRPRSLTDTVIAGYAQSVELAAVAAYTAAAPASCRRRAGRGHAVRRPPPGARRRLRRGRRRRRPARGQRQARRGRRPRRSRRWPQADASEELTADILGFAKVVENQAAYTYAAALTLLRTRPTPRPPPRSCRSRPSTPPCCRSPSARGRTTCSPPGPSSPPPSATAPTRKAGLDPAVFA